MFNPTEIVIQAFVQHLQHMYGQIYGVLEPTYPDIIGFVARLSLENIADSDAAYHDMNHTIMVTLVGQELLRGKHIRDGGVTPRDDFALMPRYRVCTGGMSGRPRWTLCLQRKR